MHNIKRVGEDKANSRIFTWFGNPRLRPRLQAHRAWGFHYPSLSKASNVYNWLQGVNEPLQQEIISPISSPQVFPTLVHSQIDKRWKLQHKLSLRVDMQLIAQQWFNQWWFTFWKLNICYMILYLLVFNLRKKFGLSFYREIPKTSRYSQKPVLKRLAAWLTG